MESTGYSSGKYGGAIREAGGAFGAREFANEEIYFKQIEEKQLKDLSDKLNEQKNKQEQTKFDGNKK